jgi:hypothetical protein
MMGEDANKKLQLQYPVCGIFKMKNYCNFVLPATVRSNKNL